MLAEFLLELLRDQHLRQLTPHGFFRRQKKSARELHGDRRTALFMLLPGQIDPSRFEHTDEIDAAVLEESPVFDGQHGVHHHFGNVVVLHHLPLGSLFRVEQGGYQLRLQFVGGKIVAFAADVVDLPAFNHNMRRFRAVVALRPGSDLDAIAHQVKRAQRRLFVLIGVSGVSKEGGDFFRVDLVAIMHRARQGIDLRGIAEDRRAESLLNNPVVFDVEIAEKTSHPDRQHQKHNQCDANHRVARQPAPPFPAALAFFFRNLDFDGHDSTRPSSTIPALSLLQIRRWDAPKGLITAAIPLAGSTRLLF